MFIIDIIDARLGTCLILRLVGDLGGGGGALTGRGNAKTFLPVVSDDPHRLLADARSVQQQQPLGDDTLASNESKRKEVPPALHENSNKM